MLKVTGNFTVRGITKSLSLDVTVNKVGTHIRSHLPSIGFEATTTLKRSDFGLGAFVPQVSDEVHITCQADEAKGYVKLLKDEASAAAEDAKAVAKKAADAETAAHDRPSHDKQWQRPMGRCRNSYGRCRAFGTSLLL